MARPKKVVSEKLQNLLNKQDELKSILKANKKAFKDFLKADTQLCNCQQRIQLLKDKEAAKAASK